MKYRLITFILGTLFMLTSVNGNAQLTINIRYSGENGSARKYVEEMEESGIAERIRAIEGCLRYDYFFPADDPEGLRFPLRGTSGAHRRKEVPGKPSGLPQIGY